MKSLLSLIALLIVVWVLYNASMSFNIQYTPLVSNQVTENTDYRYIAYKDALEAKIPTDKFVKQIQVESEYNPNAISYAGAIGIAQFMPQTAHELNINPHDPIASLKGAANLMRRYYVIYGYDYSKALAAYNAGSGTLNLAIQNCAYWYDCLPKETKNYINMIMY